MPSHAYVAKSFFLTDPIDSVFDPCDCILIEFYLSPPSYRYRGLIPSLLVLKLFLSLMDEIFSPARGATSTFCVDSSIFRVGCRKVYTQRIRRFDTNRRRAVVRLLEDKNGGSVTRPISSFSPVFPTRAYRPYQERQCLPEKGRGRSARARNETFYTELNVRQ